MAITKTYLKNIIATRLALLKNQTSQTVEVFLEKIKDTPAAGEDIAINRFRKFCVKEKKSRRGRNPQTEDDLILN